MNLKQYIKSENKTLVSCANELGVAIPVFHRWVSGKVVPSKKNMNNLVLWSNGAVQPNDFYLSTEADEA